MGNVQQPLRVSYKDGWNFSKKSSTLIALLMRKRKRKRKCCIQSLSYRSVRTPSKREVIYALKSMKNGQAAGSDKISAEILKFDSSKAADMFLPLFHKIHQR
jgi:hypothetical protein